MTSPNHPPQRGLWPLVLLLLGIALSPTFGHARIVEAFDRQWLFHLGDLPGAEQPDHDHRSWRTLNLPHDWSAEQAFSPTNASGTGYLPGGIGWYRKAFVFPTANAALRTAIRFDGVYRNSDVWINGHHLGHRPFGYIGFEYDLTPHLQPGQTNVLAVRVERQNVADSRWYTGSGIYRHVRLIHTDPIRIAADGVFVTTPRIRSDLADISTQVEVVNGSAAPQDIEVVTAVVDRDDSVLVEARETRGLLPNETFTFTTWQQLPSPRLWGPADPSLYTLRTRVIVDNQTRDQLDTVFGIRSFHFDSDEGFFLNGENLLLKGICMHHDGGVVGAAVPEAVLDRRLRIARDIGVNAIRCSHNPMAPELYRLCDELGLLVLDEAFDEWEIGKRKWVQGRNVGTAERFGYAEAFEEWAERDVSDMVRQHRNHPSIILWSLGNEIDYPTDPYVHPESRVDPDFAGFSTGGKPSVTRLTAVAPRLIASVKRQDPTRPVTMALANVPAANGIGLADMLDVAGYNYQEQEYASDHDHFPARVIYGSENGRSPRSWQIVRDRDYISGLFLWVGFDFLGEAGEWPSHGSTAGLFDRCGFPKTSAFLYEAFWKPSPVVHLVSAPAPDGERQRRWRPRYEPHWTWNTAPGSPMNVRVFSNCDEVELKVNGRSLGTKPVDDSASVQWDVPYEKGKMVAVGYMNGAATVETTLSTAADPVRLSGSVDNPVLRPGETAHLILTTVDASGTTAPHSESLVTVTVTGKGRLLGLDNADQSDPTPLRSATRTPRQGRLLALIQADDSPGPLEIVAEADGLQSLVIRLDVK